MKLTQLSSFAYSPKNRYLRITKDEHYSQDQHYLTNVVALAENTCAYDIDPIDEAWLQLYNGDRAQCGAFPINATQFERVIEELEVCLMMMLSSGSISLLLCVAGPLLGTDSSHT